MSGCSNACGIRRCAALLPAVVMLWACVSAHAADAVEAGRVAGDAAAAAVDGGGLPALPEETMAAYLDGRAMWMDSAAELNHYPGPRRVLELATVLGLSADQRQAVTAIQDESRQQAIDVGRQLIALEQRLNRIFAWGQASEDNILQTVTDIGTLQAKLRMTHLLASIRTRELLSRDQIDHYDLLQGYGSPNGGNPDRMGCNAMHHHGR